VGAIVGSHYGIEVGSNMATAIILFCVDGVSVSELSQWQATFAYAVPEVVDELFSEWHKISVEASPGLRVC
jgi:hypothetical protein